LHRWDIDLADVDSKRRGRSHAGQGRCMPWDILSFSGQIRAAMGQVRGSGDLRRSSQAFHKSVCGNEIAAYDVSNP
jgi:hypothetical protein